MAQPDGQQASILTKLRMQVLYLLLVIFDPERSWCSSCPVLQRIKHFVNHQKFTQIVLSWAKKIKLPIFWACNILLKQCWEWCMKNHKKCCTKNHLILKHMCCFLPEGSDKLNFHTGVSQVTLSLNVAMVRQLIGGYRFFTLQTLALVEPWCEHWICSGWRKGTSRDEATLNSEEIKPIYSS